MLTTPLTCLTGQVLKVWGKIVRKDGKKAFIEGGLVAEDGTVHALLDGITVECKLQPPVA